MDGQRQVPSPEDAGGVRPDRLAGERGDGARFALGNFLTDSRNAVLIGGTGSGKTHLAIAIRANCVREREARLRFFNTVDQVS